MRKGKAWIPFRSSIASFIAPFIAFHSGGRSDDYFATSTILIPHGNRFAVHAPYWFVAAMNPVEELEVRPPLNPKPSTLNPQPGQ